MNFQTLHPVENSKQYLNTAFQKAREKASLMDFRGKEMCKAIKQKESSKIDIIKEVLTGRLEKIMSDFPEMEKLPTFYHQLMRMTIDIAQMRKSFGAVRWAIEKIKFFQKNYARMINRETNRFRLGSISKEYYGRISSVMKQIDSNLKYLEGMRRVMKTYPDVKEMFTVCVYGFPNVGKTTLLNKLTGTKAKVAGYSFTTKTINVGYFSIGEHKIQVMDVPGTLARPEKMNLIEMQAELVLKELANLIIFVFDVTGQTEYSIEKQEQLLKKIGKDSMCIAPNRAREATEPFLGTGVGATSQSAASGASRTGYAHTKDKKVLIYVSKQDMLSPEELGQVKYKLYNADEIKEEIGRMVEKEKKAAGTN